MSKCCRAFFMYVYLPKRYTEFTEKSQTEYSFIIKTRRFLCVLRASVVIFFHHKALDVSFVHSGLIGKKSFKKMACESTGHIGLKGKVRQGNDFATLHGGFVG